MEVLHNLLEELWDRTNEYPNIEREKTKIFTATRSRITKRMNWEEIQFLL